MIRLDVGPRVFKTLARLGTEITTKAEQKLRDVQTTLAIRIGIPVWG